LRRLEAYAPPLTRPRYRRVRAPARVRARVALLLGCVMRVAYGDVHTAAARVLARYGVAVVEVAGQTCCGALHAHAGDLDEARRLARANIEAFERAEVDAVVVDAAGCGAHLKGYADLFAYGDGADPAWAERAARLAATVKDVTEYLAEAIEAPSIGRLPLRVTYQDPCHLAHAQGVRSQPRALLRKVEGLELVEMADADVCCGSAGFYNITQPEYADRLLADKLDAALATGPAAIVSANPGCMIQLAAGLRARGREVPVLHVVEVLDRALQS
ncbi:MAG: (Fe-S)-binding protein, partial [Candidatus Limnocylindria bacterium]